MPKFRKKPVVIEAVQWNKDGDHAEVVLAFKEVDSGLIVGQQSPFLPVSRATYAIKTLEGWHEVTPGDWIITGVKGEHYPCKPDVFELTYESA